MKDTAVEERSRSKIAARDDKSSKKRREGSWMKRTIGLFGFGSGGDSKEVKENENKERLAKTDIGVIGEAAATARVVNM